MHTEVFWIKLIEGLFSPIKWIIHRSNTQFLSIGGCAVGTVPSNKRNECRKCCPLQVLLRLPRDALIFQWGALAVAWHSLGELQLHSVRSCSSTGCFSGARYTCAPLLGCYHCCQLDTIGAGNLHVCGNGFHLLCLKADGSYCFICKLGRKIFPMYYAQL